MTPFSLVLAAIVAWQAVEVWHHGSIFATWRAKIQAWPGEGFLGWLGELLTCPFCLSVWVGTATAAVVTADLPTGEAWYHWVWFLGLGALKLFAYGLAVSRLANLANDLTRGVSRTPNQEATGSGAGDDAPAPDLSIFQEAVAREAAPNTGIEVSPDDTAEHRPLGSDGRPAGS